MMNDYKKRGLNFLLASIVLFIIWLVLYILTKKIQVFCFNGASFGQFLMFIRQRKLSEEDFIRKRVTKFNDYRLTVFKTISIVFFTDEILIFIFILAALITNQNAFTLTSLSVLFIIGGLPYCIIQSILSKKV